MFIQAINVRNPFEGKEVIRGDVVGLVQSTEVVYCQAVNELKTL